MSTITIDRATLELALEALEDNTTNIDGATMAGMDASIGHLSSLVDELRLFLGCAMANAKMLHNAAKPDDGPDMDAIIPGIVFRNFVDQDAALRYAIKDSAHDGMITAPPAALVPLTDDARGLLIIEHLGPNALLHKPMSIYEAFCAGIDAAEAAHGITKGGAA
jgi:hypothetical protein